MLFSPRRGMALPHRGPGHPGKRVGLSGEGWREKEKIFVYL